MITGRSGWRKQSATNQAEPLMDGVLSAVGLLERSTIGGLEYPSKALFWRGRSMSCRFLPRVFAASTLVAAATIAQAQTCTLGWSRPGGANLNPDPSNSGVVGLGIHDD